MLFLLHLLGLESRQAVLEIGSGSGWLAAVMARLVGPPRKGHRRRADPGLGGPEPGRLGGAGPGQRQGGHGGWHSRVRG
ncbi:hypothetical protein GXW71_08435 [Roseomonas hellenica]|uniref:Protein-L-isoaspartate O-methyltransferase n=1 Tax=Plastoroseomonas hellenica TaxID=2687306 RepID=A0ABS5EWU8_9PROT|nr:hypothetical protein [Plastoroseomonas hellenica]